MKLFAFAPVAFAALFTSVMAGPAKDANDDCWAMCKAVKGAPKNAMKTSVTGCEGLTGDVCDASCSCPILLLLPLLASFAHRTTCQDDIAGGPTSPSAIDAEPEAEPAILIDAPDASTLHLSKRSPPAVAYHCDAQGWKGLCSDTNLVNDQCEWFPWGVAMSFGPPAGWQCRFYPDTNCNGAFIPSQYLDVPLSSPGTPNWGALYGGGARPASWKCRQCPNTLSCGTTYNAWSSSTKPTITHDKNDPTATKATTKTMPWDWQKHSSVPLGIDPKNYATKGH
ncbi:hypothetical protein LTR47_005616 [Exophiala xenobiotica]|nr:hypothetical protein LTR41_006583 [Exophiala xenobiotica]KAK5220565.1 hypothetical protein LTR72_007187 [Exophiala xenobiotica]KAK5233523.1 hypothetical protein LTR47_005616 [Exophiala xenobiotica]KAK5244315.1 hypothetical protein LTS06_010078 [Exophiala xenobiotica]KAK5290838.1 hypothetical protein LTR14_006345 [Exophiala xenobiotica]